LSLRRVAANVGVQLYSIQGELEDDFEGTLQELAQIGFNEVEAANLPDIASARALKSALDGAGLKCASAQFFTPMLLANLGEILEIANVLSIQYIVSSTPWVADPSRRKSSADAQQGFIELMQSLTLDDWKWNAEQFNRVGEQVKTAGLQYGYHNHGFDFKISDGKVPLDELMRLTDPTLVKLELDCGWVANAGFSPVQYIERYGERVQLLHLKDILKTTPKIDFEIQSVALGQGHIDWREILEAATTGKIQQLYVELEPPFEDSPMAMLESSYKHLRSITD